MAEHLKAAPPFPRGPVMSEQRSAVRPRRRTRGAGVLAWLIVGVIMSYVWRLQDLYPILAKLQYPTIISLTALVVFAFSPALRELRRIRHPILLVAALTLGLMFLSVPTSLYQYLSFWFIFDDHLKTFVMMLMIAASIRVVRDVERFAIAHLCGAALYSVLIVTRFEADATGRLVNLLYYDPNDLGMLIVCMLPLAIYLMRARARIPVRLFGLLTVGLFITTIVKTGSRGAFLGLIAVGAYLLVKYRAVPLRVRLGAVAAGFAMLLIFSNEKYWALMSTILNPKADYNWTGQSESGRLEIWRRGMGYMMQRPLTGVGVGAYPVAEGTLSPLASRQAFGLGVRWAAAHNSFVQIAAELGVGGLLLFLGLLYTSFRATAEIGRGPPGSSERRRGDEAALAQALTGTLIGYCIAGFFLSQAYSAFMYSIYGLLVGFWYVTVGRWRVVAPPGMSATAHHGHTLWR